ncbi:hypothetical protein MKW98_004888 [Papaver atlanticum]|uniref:DNA-binding protein RHL1 n=1 Tax=Papaver atlanticum TaxID=357466 RepID=A0AAD4S986_9MAGN|nr:hypothetical protein MKW98_004888 [Papaver atlanticum]
MVKATKKSSGKEPPNPEAAERKRLKNLGFSRNLLSQTPAKPYSTLNPSKTVVKHHGKDIIKKSQRKNRFLFSFPGLISPLTSGKIGELKDLGTKNPILYLDFPQEIILIIDKFSSQFGTIVYPKNRYLTLQFSKGGKNVMCEDYFDNMIVFSEAWWIGTKDENPEEVRLEFPKELKEEKHVDHDFKGGAGAGPVEISGGIKLREEKRKPQSPTDSLEDDIDISDDSCPSPGITLKDGMEVTHRQEHLREDSKDSPGDDSDGSGPTDVDLSEIKGKKVIEEAEDAKTLKGIPNLKNIQSNKSNKIFDSLTDITDWQNLGWCFLIPAKDKQPSLSVCRSEKESESKQGPLVQATIASLFQKVDTKRSTYQTEKKTNCCLLKKQDAQRAERILNQAKALLLSSLVQLSTTLQKKILGCRMFTFHVEYESIEDSSSESEV